MEIELHRTSDVKVDPEEAIEIVPVGSGQSEVRQFQVTGAHLANFLAASQDTANTHTTSVAADSGNTLGGTLTMGPVNESTDKADGSTGASSNLQEIHDLDFQGFITGDVLDNDIDVDTAHASLMVTEIGAGDTASVVTAVTPGVLTGEHGTLTLYSDGSYTWFYDGGSGQTIVRAAVTGDMTADLEIHLTGNITLQQSDFIIA